MIKSLYEFSNQNKVYGDDDRNGVVDNKENFYAKKSGENSVKNSANFGKENVQKESLEQAYNKFISMDKKELEKNLEEEILRQKIGGNFNISRIENAIDQMTAYITEEQKQNMKELLHRFK